MRMTQGWTGLRTAVIALGLIAWCHQQAPRPTRSSNYWNTARPDRSITSSDGVTGANVISYVPITNASNRPDVEPPSGFVPGRRPAGRPVDDVQQHAVQHHVRAVHVQWNRPDRHPSPVTITGTLNGTVTGAIPVERGGHIQPDHQRLVPARGRVQHAEHAADHASLLVPSSAGGTTTMEGIIKTVGGHPEAPVPEPSTIALFLSTVGGLGLRKYVLARRQRSQA